LKALSARATGGLTDMTISIALARSKSTRSIAFIRYLSKSCSSFFRAFDMRVRAQSGDVVYPVEL
jgi:hypothetical protein